MAARKPKEIPGDDGRTIVDMNVDGMPWYVPKRKADAEAEGENPYQMTKDELRAYKWAAVRAGLLIVLVFGAVFGLFIAFCDFVWFK